MEIANMEQRNDSTEYDMRREIKTKLCQFFDGMIVRKDLTKKSGRVRNFAHI